MHEPPADLQIEQDERFQRREWSARRAGHWVLGGLLVLAAAGVFGKGGVSGGRIHAEGIEVEYQRLTRWQTPEMLRVRLQPGASEAVQAQTEIWLDRDYAGRMQITEITPPPLSARAEEGRVVYAFALQPPDSGEVIFFMEPARPGVARGRLGVVGGARVDFTQLVYP